MKGAIIRTSHWGSAFVSIITLALSLVGGAEASIEPRVKSRSVVVIDETNAAVLYSKKADVVGPIASITKLMTALVMLEGGQPLEELIEITAGDRDLRYGSGSRLVVGSRLSRGDLLHLALMSSENRAAHALGRSYPGGLSAFVRAMNAKAKALGMRTTRFVDPTGLSSNNVSSASDLVKLVMAAGEQSLIRQYSTSERHVVSVGRQSIEFRNTNTLVAKADWDIKVQKTGYTSEAGQCLVMATTIRDRPIVMVFLNSFGKLTRVAEARRIRKWMEQGVPASQLASGTGAGAPSKRAVVGASD
ncbi:MAG TPA: D-alanyl-D-alanine endopeptidase [Steroidobacter sp.]|nr:D-alanyl-D-alanine endopeptidase [Steroidobacter sp.]